jgi:hypothetical protein
VVATARGTIVGVGVGVGVEAGGSCGAGVDVGSGRSVSGVLAAGSVGVAALGRGVGSAPHADRAIRSARAIRTCRGRLLCRLIDETPLELR